MVFIVSADPLICFLRIGGEIWFVGNTVCDPGAPVTSWVLRTELRSVLLTELLFNPNTTAMSRFLLSAGAVGPPSFPLDHVTIGRPGWCDASLCSLLRDHSSPRPWTTQQRSFAHRTWEEEGPGWDGWKLTPSVALSFHPVFPAHPALCSYKPQL